METPHVTRSSIAESLARVGVAPGDLLFYHSSLRRFGHVAGGADAVVDAMLDVLTSAGTLAAPAFSFHLKDHPRPVLDLANEPSAMGAISEALRRRPGVCRSRHLTHSVVALGPRAADLTATHSVTPCGAESPFAKLLAWDAKIVLFGVDQNVNTCFHAVEEEMALPHTGFRTVAGARLRDGNGVQIPLPTRVHNSTRQYDFNYADRPLFDCGAMQVAPVGNAIVRVIRGAAMRAWALEALSANPELLLIQGRHWLHRPCLAHEIDEM